MPKRSEKLPRYYQRREDNGLLRVRVQVPAPLFGRVLNDDGKLAKARGLVEKPAPEKSPTPSKQQPKEEAASEPVGFLAGLRRALQKTDRKSVV